jgi:hypothetical protein
VVNQSGAYAGVANSSVDNATGNITLGSRFISSLNGAASAPPATLTGTWFTGGTATTTKPQLLLEPAGTTSTAWSTAGTGLGINATSGFTGQLLDAQVNGTSRMVVTGAGRLGVGTSSPERSLHVQGDQIIRGTTGEGVLVISNEATSISATNSATLSKKALELQIRASAGSTHREITFLTNISSERARIDSSGRLLVGTSTDTGGALFQVNGDRFRIATAKTPASAADTGAQGEISWDADYIYVCTATDTWKRAALSTW